MNFVFYMHNSLPIESEKKIEKHLLNLTTMDDLYNLLVDAESPVTFTANKDHNYIEISHPYDF